MTLKLIVNRQGLSVPFHLQWFLSSVTVVRVSFKLALESHYKGVHLEIMRSSHISPIQPCYDWPPSLPFSYGIIILQKNLSSNFKREINRFWGREISIWWKLSSRCNLAVTRSSEVWWGNGAVELEAGEHVNGVSGSTLAALEPDPPPLSVCKLNNG